MEEKLIVELLQEYFSNKDEIRNIKAERNEFMSKSENGCYNMEYMDLDDCVMSDCIERLKHGEESEDNLCDYCKGRHDFYKARMKLSRRNTRILRSLRAKVKKSVNQ